MNEELLDHWEDPVPKGRIENRFGQYSLQAALFSILIIILCYFSALVDTNAFWIFGLILTIFPAVILVGLWFGILGIFRDRHKGLAIMGTIICLLPIFWFIHIMIEFSSWGFMELGLRWTDAS